MFLCQREAFEPFRTFSNQTPARPDNMQATPTATSPTNWLAKEEFGEEEEEGSCTRAIPAVKMTSEIHLVNESDFLKSQTENRAVVMILN
jgi:hypothetical protein